MSEITVSLNHQLTAYIELVAEHTGMTREQVLNVMLEEYVERAKAPGTVADEKQFRAALEQTLTKNVELYRRLAQH